MSRRPLLLLRLQEMKRWGRDGSRGCPLKPWKEPLALGGRMGSAAVSRTAMLCRYRPSIYPTILQILLSTLCQAECQLWDPHQWQIIHKQTKGRIILDRLRCSEENSEALRERMGDRHHSRWASPWRGITFARLDCLRVGCPS